VKRQDAGDARTWEEPAKELDEHVSDLLAAAIESIGFVVRDS